MKIWLICDCIVSGDSGHLHIHGTGLIYSNKKVLYVEMFTLFLIGLSKEENKKMLCILFVIKYILHTSSYNLHSNFPTPVNTQHRELRRIPMVWTKVWWEPAPLLQSVCVSSQPIGAFDWSPDKAGLCVCTSFDQCVRVLIVTKLGTLWWQSDGSSSDCIN